MGSGSIGGKLEMHSSSKPVICQENCTACRVCEKNCAHDAVHVENKKTAVIDYDKCVGCGQCIAVCVYDAAQPQFDAANTQEKMAEYAYAVLKDKPAFHINFLMDISPNCDCWNFNDAAIVPNIGILASFDPVAIDMASVSLVNQATTNQNCAVSDHDQHSHDKFKTIYPKIDWKVCMDHAEEIGLGSQEFDLIKID